MSKLLFIGDYVEYEQKVWFESFKGKGRIVKREKREDNEVFYIIEKLGSDEEIWIRETDLKLILRGKQTFYEPKRLLLHSSVKKKKKEKLWEDTSLNSPRKLKHSGYITPTNPIYISKNSFRNKSYNTRRKIY